MIQPYAATAASQHLTVGGLIDFDYRLACVPTTLKIISVSAFLDTTFRIISVKDKSRKLKRTSRRTLLFEVNADRPINEDTRLEAAQADGTRVTPLVNVSTMPVRFSTPSACNPLIVLQPGGSMHVSIWILSATTTTIILLTRKLSTCTSFHSYRNPLGYPWTMS